MKLSAKYFILFLLLAITYCDSFAQNHVIDSIKEVLKTEKEDTNRVNTLGRLCDMLWRRGIYDTAINCANNALVLAEKLKYKKGISDAYSNIGIIYSYQGNNPKALDYYLKALKIAEEMGNKHLQASVLGNIGIVYRQQGDYPKAIDYDLKALKIGEQLGEKEGQTNCLSNIGIVYDEQGDYPKALDYFLKALKMAEELGNKQLLAGILCDIGIVYQTQGDNSKALDYYLQALNLLEGLGNKQLQATVLGNIAIVYQKQRNFSKSMDYYLKTLKMGEELGDKLLQSIVLGDLGDIYNDQGNYLKALEQYQKALIISEEQKDKSGQANMLGNIGSLYNKTGKFKEAEEYLKRAIVLDSSIGELNDLRQYEEQFSQLYDTTGRYKLALIWYKKAMGLKDTLFNIDKDKALTRKALTYQFEHQQDSVKSTQDKKDAVHDEEVKKQKVAIYSVSGGLILVLLLALTIFRSLQQNRKKTAIIASQKAEVEKKNIVIEEKNKDILDSIAYAKRLQDAILPPLSLIKKYLPDSFLMYKPKDIVAGDFYWMERAGDNILIAAADCTGHGVPGALVSVVCSNALNRTVKEFHITEPGKILDKVRELVLETFEKSEGNIQDGMDISLCCINTKTNEVQWSGAYNSLWYIRNNEITEVPADKQPIGKIDKPELFNTHRLNLQKGDTLYLFTDGYADQFGGPKGKKFKYKGMQELLLANAWKSMEEQKNILENKLNEWKGNLEQVDDILVIGIKT